MKRLHLSLRGSVCLLLLLLTGSGAFAVGSITATVDKPQVTVGEPFTYTVTMVIPQGAQAQLPGDKARFNLFEVRDYKPTQTTLPDGSQQIVLTYTLVCFDVGTQGIKDFRVPVKPDAAVSAAEKYLAPPLDLKVASVLPEKGNPEPKGFYGPVMLKSWWADWLVPGAIALAICALVVGVIWYLRRRKRPEAPETEEEILQPDAAALRALERLAGEDLVARGELLVFYQRLDETLRAWLQARFDIPALERTRLGISFFLRVRRDSEPWRQQYLDLLQAGDRVKYAHLLPDDESARDHLEQAKAVIALAQPVEPQPEPPATEAQE